MPIPDIASLRLDSDAARYHWTEHLEISEALLSEEEARILRHEPRLCAPSRTYGHDLDPSALLILAIYGYFYYSLSKTRSSNMYDERCQDTPKCIPLFEV